MNKINYTMYSGFSGMIITDGIEKTCENALRLGFSSVESFCSIMPGAENAIPDQLTARRIKKALSQANLPVVCHSVYADVWKNANAEKDLMKELEIACELHAPFFHHTMLTEMTLSAGSPGYQEAIKHAVNIASRIADYAITLGITCIYEEQGRYVNGIKGFGGFYQEIKKRCENVGVCADLGNILFVNEKPEEFLQAYIQDVRHVHVKDYLLKQTKECPGRYWKQAEGNNWIRGTMVGCGIVDFAACMSKLQKSGYKGAISLEIEHPEPYEEGVRQAMEYLDRIIG